MIDCVELEIAMAQIMAIQEASGFRFDRDAAERVRNSTKKSKRYKQPSSSAIAGCQRVFTPKRTDKKNGYVSGAPMTKLTDFNPTSRQHIAWALQNHRGARFTKVTDTGKPKVDEATLSGCMTLPFSKATSSSTKSVRCYQAADITEARAALWSNSWFNTIEETTASITVTHRLHKRGEMLTVDRIWDKLSLHLGRGLFHPGMVMVGADLEGLELRALGHYLSPFDEGVFADVVINGDIHSRT